VNQEKYEACQCRTEALFISFLVYGVIYNKGSFLYSISTVMELTELPRLKLGNIVLEEALRTLCKNSPFFAIKS